MLIPCDTRHSSTRFTLRTSAQRHNLITRQRAISLFITERCQTIKVAKVTRNLDSALHGTTNHHNLTFRSHRRFRHRTHTCNVGRKRGHSHTVRRFLDDAGQLFLHIRFTRAHPIADRVGAVANENINTFVAQLTQTLKVNRFAHTWCQIDLPVTGMQNQLSADTDSQSTRLRDRVGHGHQLNIKDTGFEPIALINNRHWNLVIRPITNQLGFQKPCSKRCGINRQLKALPKIGQRAIVVFMCMGDNDPINTGALFFQKTNIRKNQIHARHFSTGEGHTKINDQPATIILRSISIKTEVHTNFANTAQRQEHELFSARHLRLLQSML